MKTFLKILALTILTIIIFILALITYYIYKPAYTVEHFGIITIKSNSDKDGDGIDDYTDILLGAKVEAKRKPKYQSTYYAGGYPSETEGVCTDVIQIKEIIKVFHT